MSHGRVARREGRAPTGSLSCARAASVWARPHPGVAHTHTVGPSQPRSHRPRTATHTHCRARTVPQARGPTRTVAPTRSLTRAHPRGPRPPRARDPARGARGRDARASRVRRLSSPTTEALELQEGAGSCTRARTFHVF